MAVTLRCNRVLVASRAVEQAVRGRQRDFDLRAAASAAVRGVCEPWKPFLYRYQGPETCSCGADDGPTLRRELWERRFGPSQLATDACQFKSNQTTLTELAAVALVHLDNLEELERRLGASGAAYLFAYLYAYRLVRWRVEPLDPRRAH